MIQAKTKLVPYIFANPVYIFLADFNIRYCKLFVFFLFFFLWASSHNSRYSGEASSIRPISKVTERYKNLLKASIHFIPCSSQLLEAYSKN